MVEVILYQPDIQHIRQVCGPHHPSWGVDQEVGEVHEVVVMRGHAQLFTLDVDVNEHPVRCGDGPVTEESGGGRGQSGEGEEEVGGLVGLQTLEGFEETTWGWGVRGWWG